MFVFKAAVVGAGTMGGEIAQVVASAGIPVVLKDVKQEFVDTGLEKARQVTEAQLGSLVKKEKITQENADSQQEEILGRITGTTDYDGFGDVDFVIEAVPERMEIKQAVFVGARRGHARPRDPRLEHLVAVDHRDGRGDAPPGQGVRLPLLLPGVDDAADRGDRGRRHLRGDAPGRLELRPGDPQDARSAAARCPGFVVNRILTSAMSEVWRVTEDEELDVKEVDKAIQESGTVPMGPFFLTDLLGLDTVLHVAEHLHDSYGDRFYVSTPDEGAGGGREPRPEDREGVL